MVTRPGRLSSKEQFSAIKRSSIRVTCNGVQVIYAKESSSREASTRKRAQCPEPNAFSSTNQAMVAYAVGKKIGKAVQRNRLKRRLRSALSELAEGLEPGLYLVRPSVSAADMPFEELRAALCKAMEVIKQRMAPKDV